MAIDFSKLPLPDAVEVLSFEGILQQNIAELQRIIPDWQPLESDVYMPLLQAFAYREMLLRSRINAAAMATMLPYATGADLDNLAAFYNVTRKVLVAADAAVNPPVEALLEADSVLRNRITLSLYQYSTAGSIDSYKFHTFDADPSVKDVYVSSALPGEVQVIILSHEADGTASLNTRTAVEARLTDAKVRPLTDHVSVVSASIVPFTLDATLFYYGGQSFALIKATAEQQLKAYFDAMHTLGNNIHASAIHAALQVEGVQRVDLHGFVDLIMDNHQAAFCTAYTLNDGGFDA